MSLLSLKLEVQKLKQKKIELLETTIDKKLKFEEHISGLYKKASIQLNLQSRLQRFMGKKQK